MVVYILSSVAVAGQKLKVFYVAPLIFSCVAVAVQISDCHCVFYIFRRVAVAVTSQFVRKSFVSESDGY